MAPPWAETQTKVVIEFQRGGGVGSRTITFRHRPETLPTQLHGRIDQQVWASLMQDCMELAKTHPYTQKPSAGRCLGWLGGLCMSFAVGFCFLNPDGGDIAVWLPQVMAMLERHRPFFSQAGCHLSIQDVHGSFWVQIDVDPKAMAIGQPVPPTYKAPTEGEAPQPSYPTADPAYASPAPGYASPAPGYAPPPAGYAPPPTDQGYAPPPAGYAPPPAGPGYPAPERAYAPPAPVYGAPPGYPSATQ